MVEKKAITQFGVGRFSNGAHVILGFVYKGVIYGMVTRANNFSLKTFGSLVKVTEFKNVNDKFPFYRQRYGWLRRLLHKKRGLSLRVEGVNDFITEIADMPHCCALYRDILITGRSVLTEKSTRRAKLEFYSKLSVGHEYVVTSLLAKKYGKYLITEVQFEGKKPKTINIFEPERCYIHLQWHHTPPYVICVVLKMYDTMGGLIEQVFAQISEMQGIKDEFNNLSLKKK